MTPLSRRYKKKNSVSLIAHDVENAVIAEQYKLLRTNIQFASVDKSIQSIMITSPDTNEGKSTTAANLAITLAQQEKKVLLMDTDLRKPSIHSTFEVDNTNGITSILTNNISLDKAILKTHIDNLAILTSGPIPPNPSELLNSKAMENLLQNAKDMYDYIILDTPPVLAVADSQIIGSKCDGIIMVVKSGITYKEQAIKTEKILEKTNTSILGVVLNGVELSDKNYGYLYN